MILMKNKIVKHRLHKRTPLTIFPLWSECIAFEHRNLSCNVRDFKAEVISCIYLAYQSLSSNSLNV